MELKFMHFCSRRRNRRRYEGTSRSRAEPEEKSKEENGYSRIERSLEGMYLLGLEKEQKKKFTCRRRRDEGFHFEVYKIWCKDS